MNVGIFGGSFDPIHNGHLKLAHAAILELGLDKIIFVPCGESAYQNKQSNAEDCYRIEMLCAATEDYSNIFELDYYEIAHMGISYTIDTIKYLLQQYKHDKLCLLFGPDTKKVFYTFKDYKEIQKLVKVYFASSDFMEEQIFISSTVIRKRIQKGLSITGLVPKVVETIIIEKKLYE